MAIAPDGRSLYVVNYESGTLTKVKTDGMRVIQSVSTGTHPIGVTYEPSRNKVWVAVYTGRILVYKDR
jgi:YVTN family beta-propeller protein